MPKIPWLEQQVALGFCWREAKLIAPRLGSPHPSGRAPSCPWLGRQLGTAQGCSAPPGASLTATGGSGCREVAGLGGKCKGCESQSLPALNQAGSMTASGLSHLPWPGMTLGDDHFHSQTWGPSCDTRGGDAHPAPCCPAPTPPRGCARWCHRNCPTNTMCSQTQTLQCLSVIQPPYRMSYKC